MFINVSNVLTGTTSVGEAAKKLEATCRSAEPTQSSPSLDRDDSTRPVEPSSSPQPEPLIIFAFDEAHTLTQVASEDEDEGVIGAQSPFSHLRRTLRSIRGENFFSLFLSTTGKITQFTSARAIDPSNRVQTGELSPIPPFTALGWDHLSSPLNLDSFNFGNIDFQYQVRLGRPM
jgi:hypothetical protein